LRLVGSAELSHGCSKHASPLPREDSPHGRRPRVSGPGTVRPGGEGAAPNPGSWPGMACGLLSCPRQATNPRIDCSVTRSPRSADRGRKQRLRASVRRHRRAPWPGRALITASDTPSFVHRSAREANSKPDTETSLAKLENAPACRTPSQLRVHPPECVDNLGGSTVYTQVSVAQPSGGKMSSVNQTRRLQPAGAILLVLRVSRFSRRSR
jgi:hypothetical protein